ncbi:hypothetical protein MMC21_003321 [Puttea exsequens]|nr:hypothetical protein [Puttea exsequens]
MRCSLTFSICGWFAFAYSLPPTGARVVVEIGDGQIQVPVLNPGGSVGSNSLVWEVNAAGTTVVYGISIGLEPSGKVITRTVSTLQLTTDTRSSGLSVVGIAVASENSDGVLITSFRPKSDIPSVPASATTFSILDTDRPGSSFLIVGIGVVSTASQNLGSGPVSATIPSALSIIIQSAFPVIGQVTGSAAGGAILVAETDSAGHDLVVAVPLKGVQNHHPTSFLSTSSLSTPAATSTISILPASASVQAMTTTSCSTAGAMITTTQKGNNKVTVVPEICAAGLLPAVGVGALSFILFNFAFGCLSTYSLLGFVFHFRCNSDNNPTAISVELKPTPFELPKSPKPSQHSLGSSTCSGSVSTTIAGTPVCCATSVVITGETYCALASATLVDVMLDLGTKPKGPEGDAIQYPSNFNFASLESNSAYQPSGGDDSHLATGAPRPTVMSSSKFSATKT